MTLVFISSDVQPSARDARPAEPPAGAAHQAPRGARGSQTRTTPSTVSWLCYPSLLTQQSASTITVTLIMNYVCTFTKRVHCHVRLKVKVVSYSSKILTLFHWLNMAQICCNRFCRLQSVREETNVIKFKVNRTCTRLFIYYSFLQLFKVIYLK